MTLLMDMPGVVCADCDRPIPVGAPYSQSPLGVGPVDSEPFAPNDVIVAVVCPTGTCRASSC